MECSTMNMYLETYMATLHTTFDVKMTDILVSLMENKENPAAYQNL